MKIVKLKRGDDFSMEMKITNKKSAAAVAAKAALDADPTDPALLTAYENAIKVDLTGWTFHSQMRCSNDKLLATLTVENTDLPNGVFTLKAANLVTATWTPRTYNCDIEFTRPGLGKISSNTFQIVVEEDVSYG